MRTSFIIPRKKYLFSMFSKIWIIFILLTIVSITIFNFFVIYKTSDFKTSALSEMNKKIRLEKQIDLVDEKIGFILRQKAIAEEIYANNTILKDSMKNLFDLVPDQITLSKVIMAEDSLIIYGTTPTKDTYNFLLSAPLKSIFHTSNTIFYLKDDGWYSFVSTNKIINPDKLGD